MKKTFSAKPNEVNRAWWVINAEGQTLGRLATVVANLLRGKHKPQFTPNIDTGDFVVIVNADKVQVTGKKLDQKRYTRYTGYPGGLRVISLRDQLNKDPRKVIEHAVHGMIPNTTLGRQQRLKLKVYAGPEHPHTAQQPAAFTDLETRTYGN